MVFKSAKDVDKLMRELAWLQEQIASHPLNRCDIKAVEAIIENADKENDKEIQLRLKEQNLPSLEEFGRLLLESSHSIGQLHRERRKLEDKIKKLGKANPAG